jgi:hypothetical protein
VLLGGVMALLKDKERNGRDAQGTPFELEGPVAVFGDFRPDGGEAAE